MNTILIKASSSGSQCELVAVELQLPVRLLWVLWGLVQIVAVRFSWEVLCRSLFSLVNPCVVVLLRWVLPIGWFICFRMCFFMVLLMLWFMCLQLLIVVNWFGSGRSWLNFFVGSLVFSMVNNCFRLDLLNRSLFVFSMTSSRLGFDLLVRSLLMLNMAFSCYRLNFLLGWLLVLSMIHSRFWFFMLIMIGSCFGFYFLVRSLFVISVTFGCFRNDLFM